MSGTFGAGALRHFRLAAQMLGWRPNEFWTATPAELGAALAPPDGGGHGLDRGQLNRMMERDNADQGSDIQ